MLHRFMENEVGREYTREHDQSRRVPGRGLQEDGRQRLARDADPRGARRAVAADPVMYAIFCEAIAKFSLDTAACLMTSMFTVNNFVAPRQRRSSRPSTSRRS